LTIKKRKIGYLDHLNAALKRYQYLINFVTIVLGFTGVIVAASQLIATEVALNQSIYTFKGEQYPILSFKILNKDQGLLQIENIIPNDMLFQYANVYWHPEMSKKISNPSIRIHDKIWFLSPITTYFMYEYDFEKLFKKHKKNEYLICQMPVALGINYVKYGEVRMVYGAYNIELSISKNRSGNIPKYNIELLGAYLSRYLDPATNINKELSKSDFLTVIDGQ
jgi:hypothetical protein